MSLRRADRRRAASPDVCRRLRRHDAGPKRIRHAALGRGSLPDVRCPALPGPLPARCPNRAAACTPARDAGASHSMRLSGKVALISGGARGMGAVEARLFAMEKAKVVIGDVLDAEGHAVEAEIKKNG